MYKININLLRVIYKKSCKMGSHNRIKDTVEFIFEQLTKASKIEINKLTFDFYCGVIRSKENYIYNENSNLKELSKQEIKEVIKIVKSKGFKVKRPYVILIAIFERGYFNKLYQISF